MPMFISREKVYDKYHKHHHCKRAIDNVKICVFVILELMGKLARRFSQFMAVPSYKAKSSQDSCFLVEKSNSIITTLYSKKTLVLMYIDI